jgi:hypothetical protein
VLKSMMELRLGAALRPMTTAAIARPKPTPNEIAAARPVSLSRIAYGTTVFVGAFLLFQVQMIVGKYLLPWFGGAPAVWTTCMLFFQIALLAGYAYAHASAAKLTPRRQGTLHLALLGIAVLAVAALGITWRSPITPPISWRPQPGQNPIAVITLVLAASVGLPFFVLSSTGPLMQRWFGDGDGNDARATYRLYSLSNLGSLGGLLSYPFLIERVLRVHQQAWMWSAGFAVFVACCGSLAVRRRQQPAPILHADRRGEVASAAPPGRQYVLWIALAACGSALLLATTNLLCQEVAVTPLLWVLPLALYLGSFILCFDHERWYRRGWWMAAYLLACVVVLRTLFAGATASLGQQIASLCVAMFCALMLCHGELAKCKPQTRYLTRFYLLIAAGGAVGGLLIVIVAPLVLRSFADFQILLLASGAVALLSLWNDQRSWMHRSPSWLPAVAVLGAMALPMTAILAPTPLWLLVPTDLIYRAALALPVMWAAFALWKRSATPARAGLVFVAFLSPLALFGYASFDQVRESTRACVMCERNFFGVKRVVQEGTHLTLINGRVRHGEQNLAAATHMEPTTYYARDTGVGLVLAGFPRTAAHANLNVGLVGLGAGTLAAYGRAGDNFRFYEIDPAVAEMSQGASPVFTFVRDGAARNQVILGDGRLVLEREVAGGDAMQFDVLVLDAFSSDAIPVHLLTKEAMALYLSRLRSAQSVLAFHISNRAVDLKPVLLNLAQHFGLTAVVVKNSNGTEWVLLARDPAALQSPDLKAASLPLTSERKIPLWSDDFSNLFEVLR